MLSERLLRLSARHGTLRRSYQEPPLFPAARGIDTEFTLFPSREIDEVEHVSVRPSRIVPPKPRRSHRGYVLGQGHIYHLGESRPVDYI